MSATPGVDLLGRLRMTQPGMIPAGIWNSLMAFLGSLTLLPGPGYRIKRAGLIGYTLEILKSSTSTSFPYQGSDASDQDGPKVRITYGTHNQVPPQIDDVALVPPVGTPPPLLTIGSEAKCVYAEFDFTFDALLNITITDGGASINSSNDPFPPATTLTFASDGSGTGSFYALLFGVTVDSSGTTPKVTIAQNLYASQQMIICGNTIVSQPTSS